jgi:hypothetical protein
MKIACPNCKSLIPASCVNAGADLAFCEQCNEAFSVSALLARQVSDDFNVHDPPPGAWVEEAGSAWRIGASTRSPLSALFLVPFLCFWSGGSLGAIYGSQIANGEFKLGVSLFGIPFVLGTLWFGSMAVMSVCGKVEVRSEGDDGRVFQGVGPIGWTQSFDWANITGITEDSPEYRNWSRSGKVISLIGRGRLKFGSMLSEQRMYYLIQGLRWFLAHRRLDLRNELRREERFFRPAAPESDSGIRE